jgi:hypothetical protein
VTSIEKRGGEGCLFFGLRPIIEWDPSRTLRITWAANLGHGWGVTKKIKNLRKSSPYALAIQKFCAIIVT